MTTTLLCFDCSLYAAEFDTRCPRHSSPEETARREGVILRAQWSLKRLAWAYGCSAKGSDYERDLLASLVDKVRGIAAESTK